MTNYRSNSVDELKTLLESTRATIRTEYLRHTAGLPFDISTATAHMLAVANITSALIDKQHNMSCEELDNNQGLARMLCEMRGLPSFTPQSNSTSLGHQTGPASFSSPQVEREKIPVFSGQFREYAAFKLIFDQLVHDSPFYDEDAKVRQLLRHLTGAAAELVVPFIGQADAYQSMRDALTTEYEKGHHFKDHLKSEIEKLPRVLDRYDEKLTEFRNTLNRVWSAAKAGIAVGDDFFHTLYNLVISRFPDKLKEELVRKCADIGSLIAMLDQWKEQRERLINTGCLRSVRTEAPARSDRVPKYRSAVTQNQVPLAHCAFCRGDHEASQCQALLDPRKRKDIAAQCRLCFVCLQEGHRASDSQCPQSGARCGQCQRGSHHISLCLGPLQSHRTAAASFQKGLRPVTPSHSPIVQFPQSPPRSYLTAPMIGHTHSPMSSPSPFVPSTLPVPSSPLVPQPVPTSVPSFVPSFVPTSVPYPVPSYVPSFAPSSVPYCAPSSVPQTYTSAHQSMPSTPSPTRAPRVPSPSAPKSVYRTGAARVLSKRLENLGSIGTAILSKQENNESMLFAELRGKRIKLLLDSGSERTIIARHLVKPGDVFPGPPAMLDGIGGIETTSEMTRVFLTGDEMPPVCLYGHVLSRLPDVDVIVGRHDIPLLLRQEVLDHGRCYFDTMVGRVYISDPKERTRVAATRIRCLRVALANEIAPEEEPLVKELTEDETEPEMPLELSRTPEGRFVARLPFLPGPMPANNFFSAKHRHDRLQSRLERHDMTKEYESNLMEYVKNGHAAPVDSEVPWTEEAFYLPHREVIKEGSSTTRFRIVFDASANSPSLNERLFKGNAEQLNLAANLMSFRKHPVAVIADISKAFLQIEIVPEAPKVSTFPLENRGGTENLRDVPAPFRFGVQPCYTDDRYPAAD